MQTLHAEEKPAGEANLAFDKEPSYYETGVWEPHRKVSLVEQSTFTVEKTLNVEIDMNVKDELREKWESNYVAYEEGMEKVDRGTEKKDKD